VATGTQGKLVTKGGLPGLSQIRLYGSNGGQAVRLDPMAVAKDTQKKVDKQLQAPKRATKMVKVTAQLKEITTLFLGDDKEVRL
jgi:hypothetical protein